MGENYISHVRNAIHNFFNNKQVNIVITSFMIMFSMYLIFITVTRRDFLNPFLAANLSRDMFHENVDAVDEMTNTVLSLMMIMFAALWFGYIASLLKLPPLFGALLFGILSRNLPCINDHLTVISAWDYTIRRFAMCNMIIRWAININVHYLQENLAQIMVFGIFSSLVEVVSIASAAYFLLHFSLPVAILAGVHLGTSSPKIHNIVPSAGCFDNLTCISLFCLTIGLTYSQESTLAYSLHFFGQIFASTLAAIVLGWLVCWFPRSNEDHTQLARILLLGFIAVAGITVMAGVDEAYCGIIGALVFVTFATTRWRVDNPQKAVPVERAFNASWNFVTCPLLFALFGRKLYFGTLTWEPFLHAMLFFGIGLAARLVGGLISTSCQQFRFKEQLLLTIAMMPKATVQAALAPSLFRLQGLKPELDTQIQRLIQTAICLIFFSSAIVDYVLHFFGPKLLSNTNNGNIVIVTAPSDDNDSTATQTYNRADKVDDDSSMVTFKQYRSFYSSQYDPPFPQRQQLCIDRY